MAKLLRSSPELRGRSVSLRSFASLEDKGRRSRLQRVVFHGRSLLAAIVVVIFSNHKQSIQGTNAAQLKDMGAALACCQSGRADVFVHKHRVSAV